MNNLNYYYTDGTSYYSDSSLTQPCAAPSQTYPNFSDTGQTNPKGIRLNWAVLFNGIHTIGFVLDSPEPTQWGPLWGGATIGYWSYRGGPNMISAHDGGREVQVSYWASSLPSDPTDGINGTIWNSAPGTGRVLSTQFDGKDFVSKIKPGLYLGELTDDLLIQRVSFDESGEIVHILYEYQYNGSSPRYNFWVNAPCIYSPAYILDHAAGYMGSSPWTGGDIALLPTYDDQTETWLSTANVGFTESWAANVDYLGNGIGVLSLPGKGLVWAPDATYAGVQGEPVDLVVAPTMSPASDMIMTGEQSAYTAAATNHYAPMLPKTTYSFHAYFAAGNIADIRARFYSARAVTLDATKKVIGATISNKTDTGFALSFNPVEGATAYRVYRDGVCYEQAGTSQWSGSPIAITGTGSTSGWTVAAVVNGAEGPQSDAAVVGVSTQASGVEATVDSGHASVSVANSASGAESSAETGNATTTTTTVDASTTSTLGGVGTAETGSATATSSAASVAFGIEGVSAAGSAIAAVSVISQATGAEGVSESGTVAAAVSAVASAAGSEAVGATGAASANTGAASAASGVEAAASTGQSTATTAASAAGTGTERTAETGIAAAIGTANAVSAAAIGTEAAAELGAAQPDSRASPIAVGTESQAQSGQATATIPGTLPTGRYLNINGRPHAYRTQQGRLFVLR